MSTNNSDQSVEAEYTRYVEGLMPAEESLAFETAHPDVVSLKNESTLLGALLRAHHTEAPLRNPEFFNHQILREIEPQSTRSTSSTQSTTTPFSLWRFLIPALGCFLITFLVYQNMATKPSAPTARVAQITNLKAGDSELSAELIDSDDLAVVWVEGLEYLPETYSLE